MVQSLSTPHGSLEVRRAANLSGVGGSNPARDALVGFLRSVQCRVFSPDSVDRYMRTVSGGSTHRYQAFEGRYDRFLNRKDIAQQWLVCAQCLVAISASLGLLSLIAFLAFELVRFVFGSSTSFLAPESGSSIVGTVAVYFVVLPVAIVALTSLSVESLIVRRNASYLRAAPQHAKIDWKRVPFGSARYVPAPVRSLVEELQERFRHSRIRGYSLSFTVVQTFETRVGVMTERELRDPFLEIVLTKNNAEKFSASATIAVWDEDFVATLLTPSRRTAKVSSV